jgi:hypothetical protein
MATANPSLYAAKNTDPQDCFTITFPFEDVPQYNTTPFQFVAFPTEAANIGSDIVPHTITSDDYGYFTYFTLNGGLTYKIEARAFAAPNAKQPLFMAVVNGGSALGSVVPIGSTFTAYVSPETDINIQALVAADGTGAIPLQYPTQIVNATISIQVVDGFEVA